MKEVNLSIVIIAYNRPDSLKRLLCSLNEANYNEANITLIISIDKSDNKEVEKVAERFKWRFGEKKIIAHSKNLGLKNHVMYCGNLVNEYENLIVLEDDVFVGKNFYEFSLKAVEKYKEDDRIAGISLYNIEINQNNMLPFVPEISESDTYFIQYAQSWGQVWTKDKWNSFYQWYELNKDTIEFNLPVIPQNIQRWSDKSWLKYHIYFCILKDKYFVYPYYSHTTNFSEVGTHNIQSTATYQVSLDNRHSPNFKLKSINSKESILYDSFFERVSVNDDICFDIYGSKSNYDGYKYLLSSNPNINNKIINSYSLQLRPQELNFLYNLKGNDLFLYDLTQYDKREKIQLQKKYDYYFRILEKRKAFNILLELVRRK